MTALVALPGSNVDLAAFQARLPQPEDAALADQIQMTGFVLAELLALRKRINRTLPNLNTRLKMLEKRLEIQGSDTDPDSDGDTDTDSGVED